MDLAKYTTGLGCIRKSLLENIEIPIPSIEKQNEIVKVCNDISKNIIELENQIKMND
jgi:restriction endonuclease S subunit